MVDIKEKMADLVSYLNMRTAEYECGEPTISDEDWDNLYFQLVELEKEYPTEVLKTSPTQQIFFPKIDKLEKAYHDHAMLSLAKTKEIGDVIAFAKKYNQTILMAKMDGLTVSLRYENGCLIKAETRGNGIEGENITHNARVISGIPQHIPYENPVIIDGEVICKWDDFEKFSETYTHPRNYAAGSLRLLDSDECRQRRLHFIAWDCINGVDSEKLSDKLIELNMIGFDIAPYGILWDVNSANQLIEELKDKSAKLNYPIDGIVIKNNNCAEFEKEGKTAHHPKAALAFKFYDEVYETKLIDIEWSLGSTNVLTPIAIFEPVEIDNTTVQRASLHTYGVMEQVLTNVPYVGQTVYVAKRNMIIPNVEESFWNAEEANKSIPIMIPERCPSCGGEVETYISATGTKLLRCKNPDCQGLAFLKIKNYVSKKGVDIAGLSDGNLKKLINYGWVTCIKDLYSLKKHKDEWIEKAGWGKLSVEKILNGIETCTTCELYKFLNGISIPMIGEKFTTDIAKRIKSYNDFRNLVKSKYNFAAWAGFGEQRANSLLTFDYSEADSIAEKLNIVNSYYEKDNANSHGRSRHGHFKGISFAVTGKLNHFKNRDLLKEYIEKEGGSLSSGITKNVKFLINNDNKSESEKNRKAKEKGVPIITEEQLLEMGKTGNWT